jgi:hypothetical protein
MEQIYYGIAVMFYGIFIVRFILSWVGGDFEFDIDGDFDVSDVVSFKGFTHFIMGASGWLSIKSLTTHNVEWWDYLIAFVMRVIFVILLYYVYKFLMTLELKPVPHIGKQLINCAANIYLVIGKEDEFYKYIITVDTNVGTSEFAAKSLNKYQVGDMVTISDYSNAYYII